MIEHDARLFEELLGAEPDRIAFLGEHVDRSVRVLVTDKTNLETVLGVDLIAYNVLYDSFILLQYKKMSQVGDGWHYPVPPTSNLREQLDKMASFRVSAEASGNSAQPTLWTYRLSDNPFYFKFCEQFKPTAQDASLMPGITLSSVHLAEFLTLPEAQGDQGGLGIGYRNCPRYFNNTEFVQLARAGWIGAGRQSVALLKEVLAAGVKGGRNAMLTVIETPKDSSASARNWRS